MFNGHTALPPAMHLRRAGLGCGRVRRDGLQFVDHNFFDSEAASQPLIEALVDIGLPWWAYARADALSSFSAETWQLLRRSQFRMAYIGAEAAGEDVLRRMRKGTVPHQTLEAAARCREHGVIPELSFVLGGPEDPESEAERTLQFVKQVKRLHPEAEIILYIYTPTPQRDPAAYRAAPDGVHLPQQAQYGPDGPALPATPEEWCQPQWIDYVCHPRRALADRPLRHRIRDFATVRAVVSDRAGRAAATLGQGDLREMSRWRYATAATPTPPSTPGEALIPLKEPQSEGL